MKKSNKAFTLAEIMIVLSIIGVLTAVMLPAAFHSTPNENVMKFKKAHNTLYKVINELVNSDQYYKDGDLGIKPNGDLIDGTHDGDYTYFCNSFADIVSTKSVNCSENLIREVEKIRTDERGGAGTLLFADIICKQSPLGSEIITADNVVFYQTSAVPFGGSTKLIYASDGECIQGDNCTRRLFGGNIHVDENGFDTIYKIFCIDIDGIEEGEDPFGYGIRYDGKILTGARASEWLQKSIQEKD